MSHRYEIPALNSQPSIALGHWPTPLEILPRLTRELGGPNIWLKRDDCSGLATGGNKTRKLEYLLGDAKAEGADTIVTYGALQSNHARQTAAACARLGLDCHLMLTQRVDWPYQSYQTNGNVLMDTLFGATLHKASVEDADTVFTEALNNLRTAGKKVYVIPPGGSDAIGALGYSRCLQELAQQTDQLGIQLDYVIHASASAATQAGLVYGARALHSASCLSTHILGINVFHPDPGKLSRRVERLVAQMVERWPLASAHAADDIHVNHAYFGQAYGQPTAQCLDAIRIVAQLEGVLFDPVYSGKALAALIDQINLGNLSNHKDVILIHTE